MAYGTSSEDEFPDIEVIIQRQKRTTTGEELGRDKPSASAEPDSPKSARAASYDESIGKTPATTRRRRKLGQGQPMDGSLLKPWGGSAVGRGPGGQAPSSRQLSWTRPGSDETSTFMAGELLDRLPVKAKHTASRVVSGGTVFDSPPEERKRTRRLISRGEKKALSLKTTLGENDAVTSESDECESDAGIYGEDNGIPLPSEDEESDFILSGDPDCDDLSMTPPQRSQSPLGPRRMQRRVLSSSRDTNKKEPTWMKAIQDDPIKNPKKKAEKQNAPKISTTRQLRVAPKANLEDAFEKLKIFSEESEPEAPATKETKAPILEPMTPRKNLPASPNKVPRIPLSPWKPEHKEFWDPEVNFAWIDKHSPPKKSTKKTLDLTAPDNKEELKRRYGTSPEKKQARKAFDAVKEDLARDFLLELDQVVTNGKLAQLTETTGGLRIVWSNTLLTTAGRAHWKCKTTTTTSKQPSSSSSAPASSTSTTITKTTAVQHYASIELAMKVLSNEADLLNTVAHEFCHLAVFLLHGKPKAAHGAEFKTYGQRVMHAASSSSTGVSAGDNTKGTLLQIPRDRGVEINVTTRHSYEIEYRFVWRCADCGAEVSRHSRSVDPTQQRCGRCMGGLVQVKPVPRGSRGGSKGNSNGDEAGELAGGDAGVATGGLGGGAAKAQQQQQKTEKKKTAYQEFTSREMKALSVSHRGLSFKEKMVMVSARWSEHQKLTKAKTNDDDEVATVSTTVSVRGLAAAVEVLGIKDDPFDDGDTGPHREKKAAYDIFA
ncbi:hypothetical protein F5Y10DRAFT_254991 [Nemania abortiva]|nr:hypothetical protein F5Y10DRAFT_254991 [Nemania abortiva]